MKSHEACLEVCGPLEVHISIEPYQGSVEAGLAAALKALRSLF